MKRILLSTALMLVALISTHAQSLDNVLNSYYKANGLENLAKVKTLDITAKMSMMGMNVPMEIKVKMPNKFRVDVEMMGQKTISAFNGESGWMVNPMLGGVQDLDGAQLKQVIGQADMEGELYNYAAKGSSVEMQGKVDVDGAQAYKLKLTDKDGAVKTYYIDADTYMVKKVDARVETMGQSMDVTTNMLEYKDVKGVKIASKIEVDMPMGKQSMIMEEIKVDEEIDDSVFERPSN
ncbi:MAG TPA: outer membrane lipoprotein-sorting protein [Draconibacterium sp.]|nr:outer membrane lipoprotein-sorting protein [Draconibacterium sp.]